MHMHTRHMISLSPTLGSDTMSMFEICTKSIVLSMNFRFYIYIDYARRLTLHTWT